MSVLLTCRGCGRRVWFADWCAMHEGVEFDDDNASLRSKAASSAAPPDWPASKGGIDHVEDRSDDAGGRVPFWRRPLGGVPIWRLILFLPTAIVLFASGIWVVEALATIDRFLAAVSAFAFIIAFCAMIDGVVREEFRLRK